MKLFFRYAILGILSGALLWGIGRHREGDLVFWLGTSAGMPYPAARSEKRCVRAFLPRNQDSWLFPGGYFLLSGPAAVQSIDEPVDWREWGLDDDLFDPEFDGVWDFHRSKRVDLKLPVATPDLQTFFPFDPNELEVNEVACFRDR